MIRALRCGDTTLGGDELALAIASHRRADREPRTIIATLEIETATRVLAALVDRAPMILLHPSRAGSSSPPRTASDAISLETSGSTAEPRWVGHSRRALFAHAGASVRALGCSYADTWLVCTPLAHVSGLAPLVRAHVVGSAVALLSSFDPELFIAAVDDHRATLTSLVPTMLADLVAARWRPPAHLRTVLVGGAGCAPELAATARDLGIPIVCTYGMTETFSHVALDGRLLDGVEARIAESGHIELLAPASIAWPGWLRTGDLGRVDGRHIEITGRADDVIITGGENVSPARVESALISDDAVASACVVGLPDARWGQVVAAAVTPRDRQRGVHTARLDATLRATLASFERPRRYVILDALPMTPAGKTDRQRVIAELMSCGSLPTG